MPDRRHDLEPIAAFEFVCNVPGELTVGLDPYTDTEHVIACGGTDGVGTPYHLTVDLCTHRQMLALNKSELFAQIFRYVETNANRIRRLSIYVGDSQLVKVLHRIAGL